MRDERGRWSPEFSSAAPCPTLAYLTSYAIYEALYLKITVLQLDMVNKMLLAICDTYRDTVLVKRC